MSKTQLKVLVYGATGTQSSPIIQQLLNAEHIPFALTRHPDKAVALRERGANIVVGDLADRDRLVEVSRGMDAVALLIPFFINPMDAPAFAENAIQAAKIAGVKLIVWNSSGLIPELPIGNPSIDVRLHVLDLLRQSGIPYIVIEPGVYIENLLGPWTAPSVAAKNQLTYPLPPTFRVGWITINDVSAFIVYALEHPELASAVYKVSGSDVVTGPELAERFSEGLGRLIEYVPMSPEAFGAVLDNTFGSGAGVAAATEYRKMWDDPNQPPMHTDMEMTLAKLPISMTPIVTWVSNYRDAFSQTEPVP